MAYDSHRIFYCHLPAASRGREYTAEPPHKERWHRAAWYYLHMVHTQGTSSSQWEQLHFSASASAPSPPLHTQSLEHFSHSAGQQEQQPADKIRCAQSDDLPPYLSPSKGKGETGGVLGAAHCPLPSLTSGLTQHLWCVSCMLGCHRRGVPSNQPQPLR